MKLRTPRQWSGRCNRKAKLDPCGVGVYYGDVSGSLNFPGRDWAKQMSIDEALVEIQPLGEKLRKPSN
ncbi:MAG: hypothetical protein O3B43_06200 [Chloroflexi bacterium]|nr:hypothetical protein [Chloroflexota bacterium]